MKQFQEIFTVLVLICCFLCLGEQQELKFSTTTTSAANSIIYSCDSDSIDSRLVLYKDGSASVERMYNIDDPEMIQQVFQDGIMNIRLDGLSSWIDPKSFMANIILNNDDGKQNGNTIRQETNHHLMFKEHVYDKKGSKGQQQSNQLMKKLMSEKNNLQKKIVSYENMKNQVLQSKFEMSEYEGKFKIIEQMIELIEKTESNINEIDNKMEEIKAIEETDSSMYFEFSSKIPELIKTNPQPFKIKIKYIINRGKIQWTPQYLLSVDSKSQTGELMFMANVVQSTGENFTNALVELSTDNLGLAPTMPDLSVLTLDKTDIYKYIRNTVESLGAETYSFVMKSASMRSANAPNSQLRNYQNAFGNAEHLDYSTQNSQMTTDVIKSTTSFSIVDRVSFLNIPGQVTKSISLFIAKINLESKWYHKVIPKQSTNVYTIMAIKNRSKYQLIPGDVNVFINNVLSSQSRIKSDVFPDELFSLDIGIDRMISVKIQDNQKNQQTSGWFSTSHVVADSSQIIIENKKDVPINITVIDALPFTNDWLKDQQLQIILTQPKNEGKEINLQDIFLPKQVEGKESIIPTEYLFNTKSGEKEMKCKIRKGDHALERNFTMSSKEKILLPLSYKLSVTVSN